MTRRKWTLVEAQENLAEVEALVDDSSGDPQKRIHRLEKAVKHQHVAMGHLVAHDLEVDKEIDEIREQAEDTASGTP